MKLAGDYRFDAPVDAVWGALFDPEVLAAALPGCDKLELVDGELVGEMTIKIGPISGKFTGRVRLEDKVEPERYRMVVDGRGAPGFVKATASIALAADGTGTKLSYDADAQIGGKIASVGERLVDASARAITKQSLDGLHENVKIRAARMAAEATPQPVSEATPPIAARAEPVPEYKQADAGAMARTVAREAARSMLPVLLAIAVGLGLVIWLVAR
jgi:carbon monoxide dehydrogenase subunit G